MLDPARRGALVRLVAVVCLIAGYFAYENHAMAAPRYRGWTLWGDPPTQQVLPRTDDGGRLWRWARGAASAVYGGSSIVAEAEAHVGAGNITSQPGPWCAAYASLVLRRTGHRPLANDMAYSALAYGPHVARPRPGDLVVLRGHVGFVVADQGRAVRIVSGNWGHRVGFGVVSRAAVVAFVRT